jgi:hypothetical protein
LEEQSEEFVDDEISVRDMNEWFWPSAGTTSLGLLEYYAIKHHQHLQTIGITEKCNFSTGGEIIARVQR